MATRKTKVTPLGVEPLPNNQNVRYYFLSVIDAKLDEIDGYEESMFQEHVECMRQYGTGELFAAEFVEDKGNYKKVPHGQKSTREFVKLLAKRMELADGKSK